MKHPGNYVAHVLMALAVAACTDEKPVIKPGLVGKWIEVEVFQGYVNGGSFNWHLVAGENATVIEFAANGGYRESDANKNCTGTYMMLAGDSLEITSSCQTATRRYYISELTTNTLIIDVQVREGVVREKYHRQP